MPQGHMGKTTHHFTAGCQVAKVATSPPARAPFCRVESVMSLYPIFADLDGRTVLVVGGGDVAARKVEGLLEVGAAVRLVAPRLNDTLRELVRNGRVRHVQDVFRPATLDDAWLVIAATADDTVNAEVARHAEARRVLVNVVDNASLSRFHVPSRLRRGPLTLAISSGGKTPALARHLRASLEIALDESLGDLAGLAGRHRSRIRAAFPEVA